MSESRMFCLFWNLLSYYVVKFDRYVIRWPWYWKIYFGGILVSAVKKQPTTTPLIVLRILHKNCSAKSTSSCEHANLFKMYLKVKRCGLRARNRKWGKSEKWQKEHTRANPIAEWHVHGASTRNEDGLSYLLVSEYLLPSLWDGPKQSRSQRPRSFAHVFEYLLPQS